MCLGSWACFRTHAHTHWHTEHPCCLGLLGCLEAGWLCSAPTPAARSSALSTANPLSAGILMLTQRRAPSSSPLSFRRFRTNRRSQCLRECLEEPTTQAGVEANTQ